VNRIIAEIDIFYPRSIKLDESLLIGGPEGFFGRLDDNPVDIF
jgi:hypothetical protein